MDSEDAAIAVAAVMLQAREDPDVYSALLECVKRLNAINWERFRLRHEAASAAKALANKHAMFVRRHKR